MRKLETRKRSRALVALVAATGLVVAACAGADDDSSTAGEAGTSNGAAGASEVTVDDIELTVWFGRDEFIPVDDFAEFTAQYPNITVNYEVVPFQEATAAFLRAHQAGNAPDLALMDPEAIPQLVAQGVIRESSDVIDRWAVEDPDTYNDLPSWAFELGAWEGGNYGVATVMTGTVFTYRVDWFEEAGISHPPETWDEVLDAARKLSEQPGGERIGYNLYCSSAHKPTAWFMPIFRSMGGEYVDGVPQLDSDAGIYFLEFFQALIDENLADPEATAWNAGEMRAAFIGARGAMMPMFMNIWPTLQEALEYGEQWAIAPNPVRERGQQVVNHIQSWPYYFSSSTEHPYEASLLLRYFAGKTVQMDIGSRYQPPAAQSVLSDPELHRSLPWFADMTEILADADFIPMHPEQLRFWDVLLDAIGEACQDPDADASEMAARYQAKIESIVG